VRMEPARTGVARARAGVCTTSLQMRSRCQTSPLGVRCPIAAPGFPTCAASPMNRSVPADTPLLRTRPRWRRWLIGVTPWLLFLGVVALMSPLRS